MGIGPGYKHRGEPYVPSPPHPYKTEVVKAHYCESQRCSVAWLRYSDYDRVMVVKGRPRYLVNVDPHFKENPSILARFPATDIGFETALAFVAFMNGGECIFTPPVGVQ